MPDPTTHGAIAGRRLGTLLLAWVVTACGSGVGGSLSDPAASEPAGSGAPSAPSASAEPAGSDAPTVPSVLAEPVGSRAPVAETGAAEQLAVGLNRAGFRLLDHAAETTGGNVVLSPLSIGLAFGMADAGASAPTSEALADLFGYPFEGEERWSAFNTLEQAVTDRDETMVTVANREFPDTSFEPKPDYQERLGRWFGTAIEPLPLRQESEASRERINGWVAEQTNDLISDLLPEGFLGRDSVMVLVNALYLKASWDRQFAENATEQQPFTRLDGSTVDVDLMHEPGLSGPAAATDAWAATEIPYADSDLSMLVIVPEPGQFTDVRSRLADGLLAGIDRQAEHQAVELWLPRFNVASDVDLRAAMEDGLGVSGVFGRGGDWNGIHEKVFLKKAVHAADITVDELGTEAAAATALGMETVSGPGEPEITVRADQPFLYVIRHLPTGAVLLAGQVVDPKA